MNILGLSTKKRPTLRNAGDKVSRSVLILAIKLLDLFIWLSSKWRRMFLRKFYSPSHSGTAGLCGISWKHQSCHHFAGRYPCGYIHAAVVCGLDMREYCITRLFDPLDAHPFLLWFNLPKSRLKVDDNLSVPVKFGTVDWVLFTFNVGNTPAMPRVSPRGKVISGKLMKPAISRFTGPL